MKKAIRIIVVLVVIFSTVSMYAQVNQTEEVDVDIEDSLY
jgi:hypothetical protein